MILSLAMMLNWLGNHRGDQLSAAGRLTEMAVDQVLNNLNAGPEIWVVPRMPRNSENVSVSLSEIFPCFSDRP